jgi:hypothetical protein
METLHGPIRAIPFSAFQTTNLPSSVGRAYPPKDTIVALGATAVAFEGEVFGEM